MTCTNCLNFIVCYCYFPLKATACTEADVSLCFPFITLFLFLADWSDNVIILLQTTLRHMKALCHYLRSTHPPSIPYIATFDTIQTSEIPENV
jgi:hypothetical protein